MAYSVIGKIIIPNIHFKVEKAVSHLMYHLPFTTALEVELIFFPFIDQGIEDQRV